MRWLFLVVLVDATISPKKKTESTIDEEYEEESSGRSTLKPRKVSSLKVGLVENGPQRSNVEARGLVTTDLSIQSVVKNHNAYDTVTATKRNFNENVLAYVTPWNNHGYDVVKIFHKFSLVSPVWFQFLPQKGNSNNIDFMFQGEHDVDVEWVEDVKKTGARVVPRMVIERFSQPALEQMLKDEAVLKQVSKMISDLTIKHDLDGIVLEIWNSIPQHLRDDVVHFLHHLADVLHAKEKIIILVIPPIDRNRHEVQFGPEYFEKLHEIVDFFSLMSYDYSGPDSIFNAPYDWVKIGVERLDPNKLARPKILLGMNMYGRHVPDVAGKKTHHILGRDVVQLFKELHSSFDGGQAELRFTWKDEAKEHYLLYKDPNTNKNGAVFYPTLASIDARIKLAKEMNVGISLWEVGQGMDYFYDLL